MIARDSPQSRPFCPISFEPTGYQLAEPPGHAIFARRDTLPVSSLDELAGKKVIVHRGGYMPSNTARSGGTIFPIIKNIPPLYGSTPENNPRGLGAYIMPDPEEDRGPLAGCLGSIASIGDAFSLGVTIPSMNTTVEKEDRVDLRDLQEQIEGEAHFIFSGQIVRGDMFFANPSLKKAQLRVPQLIQLGQEVSYAEAA